MRLLAANGQPEDLSEQHARIVETLRAANGEMLFAELIDKSNVGASPINTLAKRGVVEVFIQDVLRDPLDGASLPDALDLKLNAEQSFVLSEITNAVRHNAFAAFLLHGVTGSGKTEVYIRAMQQAMVLDKGSILLVPEIALTPIFSRRLRSVFGGQVAIFIRIFRRATL